MEEGEKVVYIRVSKKIHNLLKIAVIEDNTTIQAKMEDLIKEYLKLT